MPGPLAGTGADGATGAAAGERVEGEGARAGAAARRAASRACASIAATRAAFSRCCARRPAMKLLRRRGRSSQVTRARLRRGSQLGELRVALRELPVESTEPLARHAGLLDDPAALVGGAAEPVEAGDSLVERLGRKQDCERIPLVRLLVERAHERRELLLRATESRSGDPELPLRERPLLGHCGAPGGEGVERGPGPGELRLERIELECRRVGARLERVSAGPQGGRLRACPGGAGSERDRHGREQEESRQDGDEPRRTPRRGRRHGALTVATFRCSCRGLCVPARVPGVLFLAQLSVAAIRNGC